MFNRTTKHDCNLRREQYETTSQHLTFDDGVLWAAARIVEWYDEPTRAAELVRESGAHIELADEIDAPFIEKIVGELGGD